MGEGEGGQVDGLTGPQVQGKVLLGGDGLPQVPCVLAGTQKG